MDSLQVLKRVPWDPEDLDRMQRALDREERPSWLDRIRRRLVWCLLCGNSVFTPYGFVPPRTCTPVGRLWWKLKYWIGWILEPPNAPVSSRFWPVIIDRLDSGGTLAVRWETEKPEIFLDGERLEDEQLVAEWPLVRHMIAGSALTQIPEDGETKELNFNLRGHPATFRFRKSGIEEEITLTVDKTTG